MNPLTQTLEERAESYDASGPSAQHTAALLRAAKAEIERLRAVLEEFARQKTEDEMSEEEYDQGDIWGAYETFIRRAREAL